MTGTPLDDYVTQAQWAKARGVSVRTLKRDETLRRGPRAIRLGQARYYKKSELAAWLESLGEAQHQPAARKRAGTGRLAARRRARA